MGTQRFSPLALVPFGLIPFALVAVVSRASAEDLRLHANAGAARAVGGPQGAELGTGGGGGGAIELPLASAVGVQAGAGFVALSSGAAPSDSAVAARSTGTAVFGALGVRVHPMRVAGPWVDVNGGVAQTGSLTRPAFDAHLGWEFRLSRASRWDMGPFVGYTQIVQPNDAVRPEDARIVWAGVSLSLGGRAPEAPPPPPPEAVPPPVIADADGPATATSDCPEGTELTPEEDCEAPPMIAVVNDRIVLGDVINFDFDSPRIRPRSRHLVASVAKFLRNNPDLVEVSIEGHADARGTEEYNLKLSESRAQSTRDMLIHFGVDPERLKLVGYGKSRLKVPTADAAWQNRRVEFIVQRKHEPSPMWPDVSVKRGKL